MITSIHEIWSRIQDSIPVGAQVCMHGNSILEITHVRRYIRVVLAEDTQADRPFFVASYTRDRLPKTAFYIDTWVPVSCNGEEAVDILSKV